VSFYEVTYEKGVISAVATAQKLTNAVFSLAKSWWSGGAVTDSVKSVPSTPMFPNCILLDTQRTSESICISPTGHLAAISDALGRVLLVDIWAHTVVRMWKGYRNAQCAFLIDYESRASIYLVIYATKRGILEVWKLRHGGRLSAVNVGPGGRLFSNGQLGATNKQIQRIFLLSQTGALSELKLTPTSPKQLRKPEAEPIQRNIDQILEGNMDGKAGFVIDNKKIVVFDDYDDIRASS